MCHESPTAQFIGSLANILGDVFLIWHLWKYDRCRCMLFNKRTAFRFVIVWMFILSAAMLTAWNIVLVWVKYSEYYAVVHITPTESKIVPVPYHLWEQHKQTKVRITYQLLSLAWGLITAIHAEEVLYWAYLINAIKKRDSIHWFKSIWFKVWVFMTIAVMAIFPAVANIEITNLVKMEANIFLCGSTFATVLFCMSLWLYIVFPQFVNQSRRQGANPEVLARLGYFQELNGIRTLFRLFYVICILTLAIDGHTKHKHVNTTPFWTDLFFVGGMFSVFTSNGISLMILLPRNAISEATSKSTNVFIRPPRPPQGQNMHMQALPSTTSIDTSQHKYEDGANFYQHDVESSPWGALGDRLNVEKDKIGELNDYDTTLADGSLNKHKNRTTESFGSVPDMPFAPTGGERVLRPDDDIDALVATLNSLPSALNNFRSPADFDTPIRPTEVNIVVTTEQVVEHHT
ncbi:uncharacterized protein L201_001650 [Kwoniella dendrophila CBS 6074]|uniref:Uncharacterized protein n=1 Tax=Kwoniella dendrophila CBS 6074 TaxID=1295534 RepID=A0AAX4JMX4_9TREE